MGNIEHIEDHDFSSEVLHASIPVLVDFWASWCTPCKMILPILEEVASEYSGRVKVVKMDVDENPKVPSEYEVTSIPSLILFKEGKMVNKLIGAVPKAKIKEMLDSVL